MTVFRSTGDISKSVLIYVVIAVLVQLSHAQKETGHTYDMVNDINAGVNYYELLEISEDADKGDIKRAYRKLSMIYHPDKNKAENAVDTYLLIQRAYSVLSDEEAREEYDDYITNGIPWMAQYDTYMEYWGAPKHDIKVVVLWTIIIISVGKYFIERQHHSYLLECAKNSRRYQIKYNEWKRNQNNGNVKKKKNKDKQEVEPEFVIEINGSRFPTWKDVFIVQIIFLPIEAGDEFFHLVLNWILYLTSREIPQPTPDEQLMDEYGWTPEELERKKALAAEKAERMKYSSRAKQYRRWKKKQENS